MSPKNVPQRTYSRRDAIRLAGTALAAGLVAPGCARRHTVAQKKVVVAGGGLAGLCCAYDLMEMGHDVIVLEASDRVGGHVMTTYAPFPDGLYADLGAEHCMAPGYEVYRDYVARLGLTLLHYPRRDHLLRYINGKPYTDEMLLDPAVLAHFGFNRREIDYIRSHGGIPELPFLYAGPFLDAFTDEDQPFGLVFDDIDATSDDLDKMTVKAFLQRERASAAAMRFIGLSDEPALLLLWRLSTYKRVNRPLFSKNLFRIKGGNQGLPNALAAKLGPRILRNSPLTGIRHGDSGVTLSYGPAGNERKVDADYLVSGIALPLFLQIPVQPAWPAAKEWVLENAVYTMHTRVVFQCRTRFWEKEGVSPNLYSPSDHLHDAWPMAEEVPTERGILLGTADPETTADQAVEALKRYFPGDKTAIDLEKVFLKEWYMDNWAPKCSLVPCHAGQLAKFWPALVEPVGRIHFVGAYSDAAVHGGQEAATRSAQRVARRIDSL